MAQKLPASFYLREDVLAIARDLPGFSLYMLDCKIALMRKFSQVRQ